MRSYRASLSFQEMKQIKNKLSMKLFKAIGYITARTAASEVAKQSITTALPHTDLIKYTVYEIQLPTALG